MGKMQKYITGQKSSDLTGTLMPSEATSCFVALTCCSIWPRKSGAFWSFAAQRKPNHNTVIHNVVMEQVFPITTLDKNYWE